MGQDEHPLVYCGPTISVDILKELENLEPGNYFSLLGTSLMYVYDGEDFEEVDISCERFKDHR